MVVPTVMLPDRNPPRDVVLRLRHPTASPIRNETVNGGPWQRFDAARETVSLGGLCGTVRVEMRQ